LTQTTTDSCSVAQVTANTPKELQEKPQWVLWRGEDRVNEQTGVVKVTKIPINPQTLHKASTTDPRTWGTFADCCAAIGCALEEWKEESLDAYRGGGLGFVFTENDSYAGIDLDHCRNPETGEVAPWAQQIITVLKSYTEVSPSGTGLHIFAQGKLSGEGHKRHPIELYDRRRFFTVTGDHYPGTPTTIEDRQAVVELLYAAMPILAKLLADSDRREKFQRLFTGDISGYSSQSEADLALCSLAAHVGATAGQIDALMRLSGLMRPKWDERHGTQTYGQMTIAEAREGQHETANTQRAPLSLIRCDTVKAERVDWLWKPYLPLGKIALLEGDPGTGKSTLTALLAAHVTTGRPFPGTMDARREPGNVLFLQCEDGLADTTLPRLLAIGVDVSRVYVLRENIAIDDAELQDAVATCQPTLVVIDPLQGYLKAKLDMHRANQTRGSMEPIRLLAEKHQCTILAVRHFAKTTQEKALYRGLGSIDFVAMARSVLQIDPMGVSKQYVLTHAKTNIGPQGAALGYTIVPVEVPLSEGGTAETSRIEWAENPVSAGVILDPMTLAVVEALEGLGGDGNLAAIAESMGVTHPAAVGRLNKAISAGCVKRDSHGHYVLTILRKRKELEELPE
jgi:putative DNA primase/helicase